MIKVLRTGLRSTPAGLGRILHRSLKAVNLEFSGRVVTLLNRDGILTPSSIILETDQIPAINSAQFDGEIFHTDIFDAILKNRIDLALVPAKTLSTDAIRDKLRPYIEPMERSIMNAVLLVNGLSVSVPTEKLEAEVLKIEVERIQKCRSVEDAATALLGFGFGLTPSGDDFILGSIGVMQLSGLDTEYLRPVIMSYNNVFSRTILLDGLDGYFPQPLLEVLEALESGSKLGDKIDKLKRIGHTSGFDMLAGMYYTAARSLP
ncbi:MAG: DUF2877 domain-containing protein [Candidatus Micrarchaeia archaeon]